MGGEGLCRGLPTLPGAVSGRCSAGAEPRTADPSLGTWVLSSMCGSIPVRWRVCCPGPHFQTTEEMISEDPKAQGFCHLPRSPACWRGPRAPAPCPLQRFPWCPTWGYGNGGTTARLWGENAGKGTIGCTTQAALHTPAALPGSVSPSPPAFPCLSLGISGLLLWASFPCPQQPAPRKLGHRPAQSRPLPGRGTWERYLALSAPALVPTPAASQTPSLDAQEWVPEEPSSDGSAPVKMYGAAPHATTVLSASHRCGSPPPRDCLLGRRLRVQEEQRDKGPAHPLRARRGAWIPST